jgi:putative MATE family efflux protein
MLSNPPPDADETGGGRASLDLQRDPPPRLIWRLALPAIIGLSANALYQTVDIMFLGWLGAEAISAVSQVFPILILLAAIGEGIAIGTASYAARMLGAGQPERADEAATTGFVLAVVIGIGVSMLTFWQIDSVLHLFGVTEAALPLARDYLRIALCGYTLLLLQIFGDFLAISEGNTRFSMWVLIVAFGINAVLDPIFIFTLDMGVSGAAAATLIAQMTAAAIYIGYFVTGTGRLKIAPRFARMRGAVLREIAALGIPAAFATMFTALAFALVYGTAGQFGENAVAGIGITLRLFSLGALPVFGFCLGARAVLGHAAGAGDSARVVEAMRFMLLVTFGFCAAYALVILSLAPAIFRLFTNEPDVAAIGVRAAYACFLFFAFFGLHVVLLTFLQSTGKAALAGLVLLAPQGYFLIPGLLLLPPLWGFDGLLASQLVAAGLTAILSASMLAWQLGAFKRQAVPDGSLMATHSLRPHPHPATASPPSPVKGEG